MTRMSADRDGAEKEEAVEGEEEEEASKRVWPDTQSMFEANQRCVEMRNRLMDCVSQSLKDVDAVTLVCGVKLLVVFCFIFSS